MHIEIDRQPDEPASEELTADLQRVLRDVREAVEDWPKMRDTAVRIADELAERPPVGVPEQEVSEATELLRWLADDHFTFLGYREYVLDPDTGGEPTVTFAASRAPAWASCAATRPGPRASAGCRARQREQARAAPGARPHQGQPAGRPCTGRPTSTTSA